MENTELTQAVTAIANSLAALTANQAMIIEMLHDKLPDLSTIETATVEKCAKNNYAIAEQLQDVLARLQTK